jgi:hypothetical protein
MPTYKTKNLPGFDHLLVVGNVIFAGDVGPVIEVSTFINTSVIIGDRELRFNLPTGSLFINTSNLVRVDDSDGKREFATDNPFGTYLSSGRVTLGELVVSYSRYKGAFTITIVDVDRTIYSDNFFSTRLIAAEFAEKAFCGDLDPEDLIFELQKLKETD